jgi:hypothetical protein
MTNLGHLGQKREKQTRKGNLEQQLRNHSKKPREQMTSAPNYAETLQKFRAWNGDGPGKGKEAEDFVIKSKEDLQLLRKQI